MNTWWVYIVTYIYSMYIAAIIVKYSRRIAYYFCYLCLISTTLQLFTVYAEVFEMCYDPGNATRKRSHKTRNCTWLHCMHIMLAVLGQRARQIWRDLHKIYSTTNRAVKTPHADDGGMTKRQNHVVDNNNNNNFCKASGNDSTMSESV